MISWGEILVEWCNCLQLNSKIKDINELRRSDFFKDVLSILNKEDLLSKIDHTFLKVLTLLSDTYKHAHIEDINCDSFLELPEDKLIMITSLLMHYTCIYDGRENFTLPLCQNLSKKSQLSIKNFLQNVDKDVTYSDLKNIIGKDSIYDSVESKSTNSPLTDVFRTPSLKRRFNYEKDRAVNKLKTALELEQYEKADVEDELRTQIKKTKKLEKLLNKSNDEINALKSEIFKLKCQTPPQTSKKPDLELTVKFLKKELGNFEHYIENNEKEHEQLREEHHLYKKKIEEYEIEYAKLQKKYLAYDEQIDELTEMLSEKSSKITHLETYCKELNEILDGYRQQRPCSTESSFSEYISLNKVDTSIVNPENLASAVIEIQLKESQELNEELMSKVNALNNELSSTKKYLDSKDEENRRLLNKLNIENEKLKKLKQDLHITKMYIEVESSECKTSFSCLEKEINNILSLNKTSLDNLNAEIFREKENNNFLSHKMAELEIAIVQIRSEKDLYLNNIQTLEKQNENLSTKIQELNSKLFASENSNEENLNQVKILQQMTEKYEEESKQLVYEKNQYYEEIKVLKEQLNLITNKSEEYCTEIKTLQIKIGQYEIELENLCGENNKCNNEIENLKQQKQLLNARSEEYFAKVKNLEDQIKENELMRAKLCFENNEYNSQIEVLKEENNLLKLRTEEYSSEVNCLKITLEQNKTELFETISKNNNYESQIEQLSDKIEKLTSNLVASENNIDEYKERIKALEILNNESSNNMKSLNELLQINGIKLDQACNELNVYSKQLEILQIEHEKLAHQNNELDLKLKLTEELNKDAKTKIESLEIELNSQKTNNSKNIEIIQESEKKSDEKEALIKKYKKRFRDMHIEITEIKQNFNDMKSYFKNDKNLLYELINDLKKVNNEIVENNGSLIHELEGKLFKEQAFNRDQQHNLSKLENQLISEKEKFVQEIELFKTERNNFCEELRISEKKNIETSNRIISLQVTLDDLNLEKSNYLQEMEKKHSEILELDNTISSLRSESENIIAKNITLQELVTRYEDKIEKYAEFKEFMKQHMIDLKGFHQKEFSEYNNLILKLKQSIYALNIKLTESEQLREKLLIELSDCQKSNSSLLSDLEKINAEMNEMNINWVEDKEQKAKIKMENQSLKNNFIDLTKTINMFNDELNKIIKSLKERKNQSDFILNDLQIGDLLKTPEKTNKTNVSVEIDNLGQKISKLNAYIDIFSEKETYYLKELENMREETVASNNNNFEMIQNLKEQILENEHQLSSQTENLHSIVEKYNLLQLENLEYSNKIEKFEEEIKNIIKKHSDEMAVKEIHIVNLQEKVANLEHEIHNLKKIRNEKIDENMENRVLLQSQKLKNDEEIEKYKTKVMSLEAQIAIFKEEISEIKKKSGKNEEEYESTLANLQVQVVKNKLEITELKKKNEDLINVKDNLSTQIDMMNKRSHEDMECKKITEDQLEEEIKQLRNENGGLLKQLEMHKELQEKIVKFEEKRNQTFLEEKQYELSQKIETLMKSNETQKETYEVFKIYYKKFKEDFDKLLSQKNSLENLTNNVRTQLVSLSKYTRYDNSHKLIEKKETLDIISEDIMKQYNRYSKQINDIVQDILRYYENNCDNIFASLEAKIEDCSEKYNIHELSDQISDLTERAVDILEQIKISQKEFENTCKVEDDKIQQKENILSTSKKINIDKIKEDDLKKKNLTLRQKVTLLENTKNNLEKTVKKLREENKKIKENDRKSMGIENDLHYKMLLQEYISYKEDQEKILKEYKISLENLQKEYEDHKDNCMRTSTPVENRFFSNMESEKCLEADLVKLQEAFSNIRIINEKLDNENILLKQIVGEQKGEMDKFISIKEAYDKLLEENNKLMTEVDTMKYKRARDRDEFLRCLKKERFEYESKTSKQIQNIKAEYETKLEKMKDKMIKLYREEVNKEMSKIKGKQHESIPLIKTIERLECELFETKQKIQLLSERDTLKRNQDQYVSSRVHGSNLHLHELDTFSLRDSSCINSTAIDNQPRTSIAKLMEFKHPNKVNPSVLDTRKLIDERQVRTLPRSGISVEEANIRRKTSFGVPSSIGNLQMEDEEEMFNNKYLTDLKSGKCDLPSSENKDSRVSELAWRNSLVPPHLKSSYPAETQFCSPDRFREDDIKSVGGAFDDSLCKLLPNEKRKKDFGTTSYKKPGPPTPSKNGGRLSLTGNEMPIAKEQNSESKKSTPGRIRSLFTGRSSSRSSIEPGTSPKKRLSIFRR
ncbi:uncharacterized protein PFB0765w [Harmonia axyridis]|uniref:uncharacterized protein PFB0765w n=1 Tax=Harmonia axyridis TaxID=115357 RepID=UPI001E277D5A|nr:uncharacterized protein PFB0765w [Harmonia axyridis]